jgi:hypothetical protein
MAPGTEVEVTAGEPTQRMTDLTDRLLVDLRAAGELVRKLDGDFSARIALLRLLESMSVYVPALGDAIASTAEGFGEHPADTPEGIEMQRQASEAVQALALYVKVAEFSRL